MMNDMGHLPRRAGRTQVACLAAAVAATSVLSAGCSAGTPPGDGRTPSPESAALRVQTVSGGDGLDERTRSEVEGAVGDVLSDYVFEAFLGDFPRGTFVQSFESFTSDAARSAAEDIRRLTATKVRDATDVRATQLDARLSFLTDAGRVHAGAAKVHFAFEATMGDGSIRTLALDGRFLLELEDEEWSIFGYDVAFDDGGGVAAEAAP